VGPIEWTVVPRIKRTLKGLGYEDIPPIEYHVSFEGENITDVNVARYAARVIEVAVPIDKQPEELGKFTLKQATAFKCLSLAFKGSPTESGKYWTQLYEEAKAKKYITSGENREVAVERSGYDATKYVTELQLGIQ